ncbi:response regulator [Chitinophaga qingshengii]|uniref:histidine kinase n=1 Tax=Chitinophaga qingshengii TaxID=1569794 RepID=A0ABR7TVL5_9BACT|nr:response regulator [Chitinophaga qingshengii]MBC9934537.1 response regulator [Chitinophaga qingshengii]
MKNGSYSDKPVSFFNTICIVLAFLSLTLGMTVFYLMDFTPAFYLELFVGILFFCLPLMHRRIGIDNVVLIFFIVLDAALFFYGIALGPVSEIHLLAAFLMGASDLLMPRRKIRNLFWTFVGAMVVLLEVNYYYHWIRPIPLSNNSMLAIRLIVVLTGTALNGIMLYFYIKQVRNMMAEVKKASEAKTRYLRETNHEIRTPLTSIMGIAEGLSEKVAHLNDSALSAAIRKETEHLQVASLLIREIINNQLDLAKIEENLFNEAKSESFSLRECINECILMQRPIAASRKINIILHYDAQLPVYILSDSTILSKIINNLASNALKYASQNSVVRFNVGKAGDYIHMETHNISTLKPNQLNDIFLPFVSHANKEYMGESTGLGLAITKQLVEKIGGTITAGASGATTTFRLSIPLKEGRSAVTVNSPEPTNEMYQDYTVLVLEDDKLNQASFRAAIKSMGATPYFAENGAEALEMLKMMIPDLIITDGKMPVMDGKKFLRTLRADSQIPSDIPVIVASGETFVQEQEEFIAAGATDFLLKPFTRKELVDMIRKHLPRIKMLNPLG